MHWLRLLLTLFVTLHYGLTYRGLPNYGLLSSSLSRSTREISA